MGRESETTSQWELGVGDSETSVRLSRGRVEAEIDFPARDSLPRGVVAELVGDDLERRDRDFVRRAFIADLISARRDCFALGDARPVESTQPWPDLSSHTNPRTGRRDFKAKLWFERLDQPTATRMGGDAQRSQWLCAPEVRVRRT